MIFNLSKDKKQKYVFKANDTDLMDRWVIHYPDYFIEKEVGRSANSFMRHRSGDEKLRKTSTALCEDDILLRTVIAKTVKYEKDILGDAEAVKVRRRSLAAQVDILNNVASNMLPEPLDFFLITNNQDEFTGEAVQLKDKEPVLILDYIPGDILSSKLYSNYDKTFYRPGEDKQFTKSVDMINVGTVMRLIGDILAFEQELYDKGYAYTALSPDHIILLGDNKPRFTGIGRICPVIGDKFDVNHINFGRQLKGYSAPEFNRKENNFGMNESVKAAIAYNLGVLIASIMLSRKDFDENQLKSGAYDYANSREDREMILTAFNGKQIDNLILRLTNPDPSGRLTSFSSIMKALAIISGDAVKEKKEEKYTIYHGTIKFIARDKGFGYVTSGGKDYRVNLKYVDIPLECGDQPGQPVDFTLSVSQMGNYYVKKIIKPKPQPIWPKMVRNEAAIRNAENRQPQSPKPQPRPQYGQNRRPAPPQKKGLLARLFGL